MRDNGNTREAKKALVKSTIPASQTRPTPSQGRITLENGIQEGGRLGAEVVLRRTWHAERGSSETE